MKKLELNKISGHCIAVWEHKGNIFSESLFVDEDGNLLNLIPDGPDSGMPTNNFATDFYSSNENIRFFVAGK